MGNVPDEGTVDMATDLAPPEPDLGPPLALVQLDGPATAPGPAQVERLEVELGKPLTIWAPATPGRYGVLLAFHGFLLNATFTSDLWSWVASHGFVVIAPQMYPAGGFPIGKPSAAQETTEAIALFDAIRRGGLAATLGNRQLDAGRIALVGHSRGGKVVWGLADARADEVAAIAGLDPVDGTGGPGGNEPRIIAMDRAWATDCLVLGTGLGPEAEPGFFSMACAPTGDNYVQFYGACTGQATELVAQAYGHVDMLNDDTPRCGPECTACVDGPDRKTMREYTATSLVRFLRASLFDDPQALTDLRTAPQDVDVTVQQRD